MSGDHNMYCSANTNAKARTMAEIETGEPAFPWGEHGTHLGGMTLRDYFAAKAMQGILACQSDENIPASDIAEFAYTQADAMIKARGTP